MSWAQRLESLRAGKAPPCQLTKLPKPTFVSFGSKQDGRFHPESAANAPDHAELRAHLLAICRSHALPERLVANLPDAELEGCELLSPEGLVRWVQVLGENERMRKGIAPPGWTQASYCHHCGPVKLWAGAPLHVIGCPWCHVRKAGGQVPRPAVTCATCQHMRRMPQTSPAGMQSCKAGHGMHYAHAEHVCDDWRPAISTVENRERLP